MRIADTMFSGALPATVAVALAAAGAATLAALYLLRLRRREVVVPFAPLWLGSTTEQRSRRVARRLREWLSLLLALLVYAFILIAAMNPRPASTDRAGRSIVVLIDRSTSMSARDEPGTRLAAARARAGALIDGLYAADRALVAGFAADVAAETGFESDAGRLRSAVAGIAPSAERGDVGRALAFAGAVLRGRPRATAIIVSDGGFSTDALHVPAGVDVRYLPVGRRRQNAGIVSFAARRIPADPGAVEAAAVVENFSARAASVLLQVSAAGVPVDRTPLTLAPGERRRHELPNAFAAATELEARLLAPDGTPLGDTGSDDLPDDDAARAQVPPLKQRRILRVGARDLYLDGALLSLGRTVTVDALEESAAQASRARWAAYDLVIFDGVAPPPPPDSGHFLYLDPRGAGSPFAARGVVRDPVIGDVRRDHPLARGLDLADVNIAAASRLALAPGDVAVAGSFGVPIIVARERRGLRIAATSFDPKRSDLPLRPAFPLLIANTLAWASRSDEGGSGASEPAVTGTAIDARESDTAPAATLAIGGHTIAPPDPPAWRPSVPIATWALLLAGALLLLEWLTYHRRWTA